MNRLSVRATWSSNRQPGSCSPPQMPPTDSDRVRPPVEVDSILQVIDPSGQVMVSMIGIGPLPVEAVDLYGRAGRGASSALRDSGR